MEQRKRQTQHSRQIPSSALQPELKKCTRTTYTTPKYSTGIGWMKKKFKTSEEDEYVRLTMNSVHNYFPVSELKPYSTFYTVQNINDSIENSGDHYHRQSQTKNHPSKPSIYDKTLSLQTSTKEPSHNSTFYQAKRNKRKQKMRFHTTVNLVNSKPDQEQRIVVEFLKDDKQVKKKQKNAFESFNQKVKQFYPKHFQPNLAHQQEKCKSKSCNQGFFKRKKYRAQQKYQVDQPGFEQLKITKNKDKKQGLSDNVNFYVFSKSKNKIISTTKIVPAQEEQKDEISGRDQKKLSVSMKQKFRAQSATMYKKYMRSSFKQRKKALVEDLNIKIS